MSRRRVGITRGDPNRKFPIRKCGAGSLAQLGAGMMPSHRGASLTVVGMLSKSILRRKLDRASLVRFLGTDHGDLIPFPVARNDEPIRPSSMRRPSYLSKAAWQKFPIERGKCSQDRRPILRSNAIDNHVPE
jgi:hypothetical protein